jgi:hypothetical protein
MPSFPPAANFPTPIPLAAVEYLLSKLPPLAPLSRENYQDVKSWERSEWEKWVEVGKEKGDTFENGVKGKGINSSWIEDADGIRVDVARQDKITGGACLVWLTLERCGVPLHPYRDTDEITLSYFRRKMETDFEELRLCGGHWKADKLWMENFSSWGGRQDSGNEIPPPKPGSTKVSVFQRDPRFHPKPQTRFCPVQTPIRKKTVRFFFHTPTVYSNVG